MLETRYIDGRKQYITSCDNCGAVIDDTTPFSGVNASRETLASGICPHCGKPFRKPDSSKKS